MRIILSEAADTHKTVQCAGQLMTVNESELRHTLRKIAVGMDLSLIYEHSAGAVHRLDSIILAVYDGGVHIVLIVIPVSRTVPQLLIQDHRSSYLLIAVLAVLGAPKVLENIAQHHSLRQEERKAGSLLVDIKEVKLASELAVVALLSLLHTLGICGKLVLLRKCYTVDTLKHLILGVALPVSSCALNELQRLDSSCREKMRSGAEVNEIAHSVEGDILALRHSADQQHFIGLACLLHQLYCLIARQNKSLHLCVFLDYALHLALDERQRLLSKRHIGVDIIVKAVVNRRSYRELCLGVQTFYGGCKHVRRGMPEYALALCVIKGQRLYVCAVRDLAREVKHLTVDLSRDHLA